MKEQITVTASTPVGVVTQVWVNGEQRQVVALAGLFDVLVLDAARFRLVPKSGVARSLLASWLGGEMRREMQMMLGPIKGSDFRYGRDMDFMEFEHTSAPMLCSGDDPHHTGMNLKPEEVKACRALVDKMRADASPRPRSGKRSSVKRVGA